MSLFSTPPWDVKPQREMLRVSLEVGVGGEQRCPTSHRHRAQKKIRRRARHADRLAPIATARGLLVIVSGEQFILEAAQVLT